MTDLTEQYQKGELPAGWYYVKCIGDEEIVTDYYERSDLGNDWRGYCGIEKVLSKAPNYSENLALQSDSLAKNEGAEIVAELKAKVKQLKKDYKDLEYKFRSYKDFKETAYDLDTSRLEEENTKIKELLKECKEVMSTGGYIFATVKQVKRARKLLENIDQALGEDK